MLYYLALISLVAYRVFILHCLGSIYNLYILKAHACLNRPKGLISKLFGFSLQHAAYLAGKQGLNVVDVVLKSLNEAGYNDQTIKKVMIQSTDSSVLEKFKEKRNYELVYMVNENIRDVQKSTIMKIKEFAKSVVISKNSVYPADKAFLTSTSDVVPKLQACNLSVYVQLFSNEFASQAWDFFADAYLEINTYVNAIGINGLVTDFPATAAKYRRKFTYDFHLRVNVPFFYHLQTVIFEFYS